MLISSSRHHSTINIDNVDLKDNMKYLRVYTDKHLNWQPQVQHINNKIAKNANQIEILRALKDNETIIQSFDISSFNLWHYCVELCQ